MFKREFKINFKSLIIWSVILIVLFLLVFSIYPSIVSSENVDALNQMLNMFPKEMMEAFNMDIASLTTAFGWFQSEGHVFLLIIGGLYSTILGSTILVKEESDKTIEYLYSKPISRNDIIKSKMLCGVVNIIIFTLLITVCNLVTLIISNDISYKLFFLLSLSPLIIYFAIFFVSMFISTFFNKTKKVMSIGIGLVFLSYFLQIIGGMSEKVQAIKYLSLFELAPAREIILNNSFDLVRTLIGVLIIGISIFLTFYNYNKKELV